MNQTIDFLQFCFYHKTHLLQFHEVQESFLSLFWLTMNTYLAHVMFLEDGFGSHLRYMFNAFAMYLLLIQVIIVKKDIISWGKSRQNFFHRVSTQYMNNGDQFQDEPVLIMCTILQALKRSISVQQKNEKALKTEITDTILDNPFISLGTIASLVLSLGFVNFFPTNRVFFCFFHSSRSFRAFHFLKMSPTDVDQLNLTKCPEEMFL